MSKNRSNIPQWVKDAKYKFCAVCGRTDDLQYHHFEPDNGHNTVPENILVLCAKHHQELHQQGGEVKHNVLIQEGIKRARERGVRIGKPPVDGENIIHAIAKHSTQFNDIGDEGYEPMTEHEIMAMLGIKEVCYCKYKRKLIEAMQGDEWPYCWAKPSVMRYRPLYDRVIKKMRDGCA